MSAIFHFEFHGDADWEPIGAGIGDGHEPLLEALGEVQRLYGGSLPAGLYQVIEVGSRDPRWMTFRVDSASQVEW